MPENRVEQVFDAVVGGLERGLKRASQSFRSLGSEVEETGQHADVTGMRFRTLEESINKAAPFKEQEQFRILGEAIEKVSRDAEGGVLPLQDLQRTVQLLGAQADLSSEQMDKLERNLMEVFGAALDARLSVDDLEDVLAELRNEGTLSASQLQVLESSIENVADAEDRVAIQRLNQEMTRLGTTAGMNAPVLNELNDEFKETLLTVTGLNQQLSEAQLETLGLAGTMKALESQTEEFRQEAGLASLELATFDIKALTSALAVEVLAESVDDAEDQFEELRNEINRLIPANPATTLNLGPVNLSLENIATTLGSILALLGPLVVTVAALAGALATVVTVIASFAAVGIVQLLDQVEQQFASITGRAEALEAVVQSLGRALQVALEPIFQGTIAGQTPIQFFVDGVRAGLRLVRRFSEVVANLAQMREVADFIDRVGDALFTGDEGPSLLRALRVGTERILPDITDLFVFLINTLPEFIMFGSRIADEILPALESAFSGLIDITVKLIPLGIIFFRVLANVVQILSAIIGTIEDTVAWLDRLLGPMIDLEGILASSAVGALTLFAAVNILNSTLQIMTTILGIGHAALKLYILFSNLATISTLTLQTAVSALTVAMNAFLATLFVGGVIIAVGSLVSMWLNATSAAERLEVAITALSGALLGLSLIIGTSNPLVAGILAVAAAIGAVIVTFEDWGDLIASIRREIQNLINTFNQFLSIIPSVPDLGVGGGFGGGSGVPLLGSRGRDQSERRRGSGGTTVIVEGDVFDADKFFRMVDRATSVNSDRDRRSRRGSVL